MRAIIIFCMVFSSVVSASVSRPFRSDFCTGYPEGTIKEPQLWAQCCYFHDLYLWAGGSKSQRKQVDQNLYACVKDKAGEFHARIMYLGITAGSYSPWKFEGKQWGNAWSDRIRDSLLTEKEIEQLANSLLNDSDLDQAAIDDFIHHLRTRIN